MGFYNCIYDGCTKYASVALNDTTTEGVFKFYCLSHAQEKFVFGNQWHPAILNQFGRYSAVGFSRLNDIKVLSGSDVDMLNAIEESNTAIANVVTRANNISSLYDSLSANVVDAVMELSWVASEKRDFLDQLDLRMPVINVVVTTEFTFDGDLDDIDTYDIASFFENASFGDGQIEDVSVSVDET